MKQKILAIINPISGVQKKSNIKEALKNYLDSQKWELEIVYSQYAKHAIELAKEAVKNNFNCVIAIGGDGTINEIGSALVNTPTILAIIPMGSGNGLARHLKIPLDVKKSIEKINDQQVDKIDVCYANDKPFLCTSGIGFDGLISNLFAKQNTRGLKTYVSLAIQSYLKFKNFKYSIQTTTKNIVGEAFMITVANANQYGNNAYISPESQVQDGKFEIVVIKKSSFLKMIKLVIQSFMGTIHKSKLIDIIESSTASIELFVEEFTHRDGEATGKGKNFEYTIKEKALKIFI